MRSASESQYRKEFKRYLYFWFRSDPVWENRLPTGLSRMEDSNEDKEDEVREEEEDSEDEDESDYEDVRETREKEEKINP
ncbi:hypothetical protein FACUT_9958 [Fusarium acutatum]|uniref:Uncharacterized protein n=1 Tax=Fusarium acutatum TaxID=78861 RepID=A0A8H4JG58_9HYPO|nr:hypothetical protein FACUT_9958 [Fusarium acutatum]